MEVAAGRYPLSVERHVMRMVDHLVPGVTAVTPHGRYYALHGLVAAESDDLDLAVPDASALLRRAEVALAAVSYAHHPSDLGWLPRAHGMDRLSGRLQQGIVPLAEAAVAGPGGYVESAWGFWGAYAGSETSLGVLSPGARPTAGPELDESAVRAGLAGLLELARQNSLVTADLAQFTETLCVCSGRRSPDGRWLARLMCSQHEGVTSGSRADVRRQTVTLLARAVLAHPVRSFTRDVGDALAFGPFLTADKVTSNVAAAPVWRGVVLRNYSVGAWRRLWSWLVEQVDGLITTDELAERFAQALPDITVQQFLASIPATEDADGNPLPTERELRHADTALPLAELGVLAAGAQRTQELHGRTRDAFLGQRGVELGPEWMYRRLEEARPLPLRDFVRRVCADLLARSQRVALSKARRRPDGSLWLPTRLHERGDQLFKTSDEGRGDVGLRLDQLGSVLASCGVLELREGQWEVTSDGWSLIN